MPITEDMKLPSDAELTVEEVPVGYPYLKAGSFHLGKYCEAQNNEFMLCRHETRDPAKCLADGREVTNCTNKFFRQVKKSCAAEFTQYAMCLERSSSALLFEKCRNTQEVFDKCMKDNLGLERPSYGYFSLARVHDTERPKPEDPRPAWLDDPRGSYGRPDVLPDDFPRNKKLESRFMSPC